MTAPAYQSVNARNRSSTRERDRQIVKASVIGIVGNTLLVAFKLVVGLMSNSIAIILDGVNNATDSLSSIVTIVGTKLAARRPDKRHPFGYGRIEYLTSVVIALIILLAGIVSLRESILKIVHPGTPSYSDLTIAVILVAILAKVGLGVMFSRFGRRTESGALLASGIDSNYDALLSGGTLVVALFQNLWGINIDGAVGVVISLVVCKAGIDVLRDALAPIIGTPEDREVVNAIRAYVSGFPNVCGVHDIVFDSFGRNLTIGSARVTVPDSLSAQEVSDLTRRISEGIQREFAMAFTVGIYAENTTGTFAPMRSALDEAVAAEEAVLDVHAFYVHDEAKQCCFDLVVDIEADPAAVAARVEERMQKAYPAFTFDIQVDCDYTE